MITLFSPATRELMNLDAHHARFWERTIRVASPLCQRRFISGVKDCMAAMARESDARKISAAYPSVAAFMKTRRDSAGCALVFALMELEIALPDQAFNHPYIKELIVIIQDISCMANVSIDFATNRSTALCKRFH